MTDITFNIINGTPNYTVVINGGEYIYVYETSGHKTISLPSGDYVLVVTDSMNCVAQTEFNIPEITTSTTTSTSSTTTTTSSSTTTTTTTSPIVCNLNYTIDSVEEEITTTTSTTQAITPVEYGALYNWYAVADERNIAAEGWSIPDNTINQQLADNLGGEAIAGKKLKSVSSWVINTGTNSSGFNAKGAGYRHNTGEFVGLMESSYIWTSIEDPITPTEAYSSDLYDSGDYFNVGLYSKTKNTGATIRLKKDTTILNPGETGIYIGNDLRQYSTICIADSDGNNKQEWLADNLMETKYRNGDWITGFDGGVYTPIADAAWAALTTEAMCYYDNDELNG